MAIIGEFGAAVRDEQEERELDTFMFYGVEFGVARSVGAMPLLRFAAVAAAGVEAEDMEGLAAMHDLIRDCLVPQPEVFEREQDGEVVAVTAHGWKKFQQVASEHKVEAPELMRLCGAIYQSVTGRPTEQPSDSSDGLSPTGESSKALSSSDEFSLLQKRYPKLNPNSPLATDPRVRELEPVSQAALRALEQEQAAAAG